MRIAVVGLGPAGAMAASVLASKGFEVDAFDASPRYVKPCGDALTAREAYRRVAEESDAIVTTVGYYDVFVEGRPASSISYRGANWWIIDKQGFVGFLRGLAETEGARLFPSTPRVPERLEDYYDIVVDARGPYASERIPGPEHVIVYRGLGIAEWDPGHALLDFLPSRLGLYWVFPASDDGRLVNFGAGFYGSGYAEARAYAVDRARRTIGLEEIVDEKGSMIAVWRRIRLARGEGIYAIGEAAGLVNSIAGEGNRMALLSALSLAEEAAKGRVEAYPARVGTLAGEARLSRMLLSLVASLGTAASSILEGLPRWFWREFLSGSLTLEALLRLASCCPELLARGLLRD